LTAYNKTLGISITKSSWWIFRGRIPTVRLA